VRGKKTVAQLFTSEGISLHFSGLLKIWFPLALTLTFFRQEVDAKLRQKPLMENPTIANPPPSLRQLTENQREHHVRVVVII